MDGEADAPAAIEKRPADGEALSNAQPFDFHMASDDPRVTGLARFIYDNYIFEPNAPNFYALQGTLVCVLLNLYSAYLNDSTRYVRYSREPGRYTKSRYNSLPVTWAKLDRTIAALTGDIIEHHIGIPGFDGFDDGRQSRMRATPLLVKWMIRFLEFTPSVIQITGEETIIRRGKKDADGKAKDLPYLDTKHTKEMRKNLQTINSLLDKTWIDLYLTDAEFVALNQRLSKDKENPVDFRRKRLRRIFNNGDFKQGGRFYHGWWQEIPSEYRRFIHIGGKQTTEIDFTGMHFSIFYSEIGGTPPDDPYDLPGLDSTERGIVKKALNALINANTEQEAIKAIQRESQTKPLPKAYPKAKRLVDALKKKHAPIAHLFGTGAGLRAQFLDSQVAERVMLKLAKEDIPALPVHDSFIVQTQHAERLEAAMHEAFNEVTGGACKLKAEKQPPGIPAEDAETKKAYERSGKDPCKGYHSRMLQAIFGIAGLKKPKASPTKRRKLTKST